MKQIDKKEAATNVAKGSSVLVAVLVALTVIGLLLTVLVYWAVLASLTLTPMPEPEAYTPTKQTLRVTNSGSGVMYNPQEAGLNK